MYGGEYGEDGAILCEDCRLRGNGDDVGLRTRGVIMERVRPIRWLWHRRIPLGLPSLILGEEGMGKGGGRTGLAPASTSVAATTTATAPAT
jgi:hypothetical protein